MRRSAQAATVMAALLVGLLAVPALAAVEYGCPAGVALGDRALVVGIANYRQANLALKGPAWDRQHVRSLLIDELGYQPSQVCVLADEQATEANIASALQQWLVDGSTIGSRVFFHFSGHGDQVPGGGRDRFDEPTDQALAAYDYVAQLSGFVRDDDLGAIFDRLQDRHATVVVDSCFSGSIFRSVGGSSEGNNLVRSARLRGANDGSVRTRSGSAERRLLEPHPMLDVWMAAQEGQSSFDAPAEAPEYGHFTRHWIELVRSSGQQQVATVVRELRAEAKAYCKTLQEKFGKCPLGLTPALWADSATYRRPLMERLRPEPALQRLRPEALTIVNAAQEALPALGGRTIVVDAALLDIDTVETRFEIDQEPVLQVRADAAGYLYVFAESPDGRLKPVLPRSDGQPVKLEAGVTEKLDLFRIDGPLGTGRVYVLVNEAPIRLRRGSLSRGAIMEVFPDSATEKPVAPDPCLNQPTRCKPADAVNDLMFTLLSPLLEDSSSRMRSWGVKVIEFNAVEEY